MLSLVELAAEIVSSQASNTVMSMDELVQAIEKVHTTLKNLEAGVEAAPAEPEKPALTIKQAFKKNEVVCMICGKGGFKALTRHLKQAHDLKPGQYRKQFGIPASQSLTAKNYSEARRAAANENNLAANLEKARAARAAKAGAGKAGAAAKKRATVVKAVTPKKKGSKA